MQVSNGHPVRLECPKGHVADSPSRLCRLPGAKQEVVASTTAVAFAVVLGAALLLLLLFSRRLYRQKGARTLSTLFASRGRHRSFLLSLLRRGRSRRRASTAAEQQSHNESGAAAIDPMLSSHCVGRLRNFSLSLTTRARRA